MVLVKTPPVDWLVMVIFHTSGSPSATSTCTRCPALTGRLTRVDGSGMVSHHAQYQALPPESTSGSVPAWLRVWSTTMQLSARQPAPMPTPVAEDCASPLRVCVAVGTTQVADTSGNGF